MRLWILWFALIATSGPTGATETFEELLDFEELEARCVASRTRSDLGTGPVLVHGRSPRKSLTSNVAVVVDTADPDGHSDLITDRFNNALFISRDEPRRWSESSDELLVGQVAVVDDEDMPGGMLTFDFDRVGPVTFYGLTVLDHDDGIAHLKIYTDATPDTLQNLEPGSRLLLTWGKRRWLSGSYRRVRLSPPDESEDSAFYRLEVAPKQNPGEPRTVDLRDLRPADKATRLQIGRQAPLPDGIRHVTRIEVVLAGSAAVDRIRFRRQGPPVADDEDGLFTRLQEEQIAESVRPQIAELQAQFDSDWEQASALPAEEIPLRAHELLDGLEVSLLGGDEAAEVAEAEVEEDVDEAAPTEGLLECPPELRCACPAMRGLRAWVSDRIATIRANLPNTTETASLTARPIAQIATLAPGLIMGAAMASVDAPQSGSGERSFFEEFFVPVNNLLSGVSTAVATLRGPKVDLPPDSVQVGGAAQPCKAFRLTPKSARYQHVIDGMPAGTARRVPRGLYCVFCQTSDGALHPRSTLDLVDNPEAGPVQVGDEATVCRGNT